MKIVGFFHVAKIGGSWYRVYLSLIESIKKHGLYDATDRIYLHFVGSDTTDELTEEVVNDPKFIITTYRDPGVLEFQTLGIMRRVADEEEENCKFWYIHTKGATTANFEIMNGAACWKEYIEYFTVELWQESAAHLDDHDIVGTEWRFIPHKHFSGNFHWSNSFYVRKLPRMEEYYEKHKNDRIMSEMYIGFGSPKPFIFHNFGQDLYRFEAHPHLYRHK